jgi:hypothetical protein
LKTKETPTKIQKDEKRKVERKKKGKKQNLE